MRRLAIRARLTATFAAAMVLVLAAAGLFVYIQLRADLDEAIDTGLRARTGAVVVAVREGDPAPADAGPGGGEERDEGFAVVLSPAGRVLDGVGGARGPVLGATRLERVAAGAVVSDERRIEGIEGTVRVLARRASAQPGSAVVAAGQSLEDRDETLSGLIAAFAVGGPVAVAVASLIGYGLAAAGLAPVEAMRRRATEVSLTVGEERLPLPVAEDEIRRLGETLNDMLDRLRRSFERERRFVADASHELRSPVAVVKTELEGSAAHRRLRTAGARGASWPPSTSAITCHSSPRTCSSSRARSTASYRSEPRRSRPLRCWLTCASASRVGRPSTDATSASRPRRTSRCGAIPCACARRSGTWSTTPCAMATERSCSPRAPRTGGSSSR